MSDPVEMICELAGCSKEEAEVVFGETNDVVEAVDRLMAKPTLISQKYIPAKPESVLTEEQLGVRKVRNLMKKIDDSRGSTSLSQHARCEEAEQQVPPESKAQ
jgi:hypothetical protein